MSEISFDVVIVGAGVIGLSIARSLSEQGLSTVVLEKNSRSGDEISSRNSGVIHAGMYYELDTLKSEFCIEEEKLMPNYVGIRPKIHSRNEVQKDFYIPQFEDYGISKFYNLQGIESPGLTSSLTISSFISKEVSKELN